MFNTTTHSENQFSMNFLAISLLGNDHRATTIKQRNLPILHGRKMSILADEHSCLIFFETKIFFVNVFHSFVLSKSYYYKFITTHSCRSDTLIILNICMFKSVLKLSMFMLKW